MRPELETIDMVRAERDSVLAELETLRKRIYSMAPGWTEARADFMQELSIYARVTKTPAPRSLMAAADRACLIVDQLVAQRDQARADVVRSRAALKRSRSSAARAVLATTKEYEP